MKKREIPVMNVGISLIILIFMINIRKEGKRKKRFPCPYAAIMI